MNVLKVIICILAFVQLFCIIEILSNCKGFKKILYTCINTITLYVLVFIEFIII